MPVVEPQPAPGSSLRAPARGSGLAPAEPDVVGTVEAADEALARRFAALGRFTRTVSQYVTTTEAPALAGAAQLVQRAQERLRFGERWPGPGRLGGHTVVALAGATGVGKSSLFNAVAGMTLSPPGHLRPTTGEAHACVWDARGAAEDLLDWLGVSEHRRFVRESELDADSQEALRGLVLLDLPDMDSIALGNRAEADRLVGIVDRVIWVLDPQKYADAGVHEQYLRNMGALRDVTIVVFNQSDCLSPADAQRCLADLVRLVEADGLAGVPVIGTSTVTGAGIDELRDLLVRVVAERHAAVDRLAAELDDTVAQLKAVAPVPGPTEELIRDHAVRELADALAEAAGVQALATEAAAAYAERAVLWRAPWHRTPPLPVTPPADAAGIAAGLRRLASQVGAGMPEPWPRHLREAATEGVDTIQVELGRAMSSARRDAAVPALWTVLRTAWWLAVVATLAAFAGTLSTGDGSWLSAALLALGVALGLPTLANVTGAWRATRHRRAVLLRLNLAALSVAREVVAPVRRVLRDYGTSYEELAQAG
jgi:predicted GTPase